MADEQAPKFKVNGTEYPVPTDLSLGEMCDAEQQFGVEFGNSATSGVRMVAALLWIAVRRVDPTVTATDIRELPAEVFASLAEEQDSLPLANENDETDESSNGSPGSSGESSSSGSDDPAVTPEPIGTPA